MPSVWPMSCVSSDAISDASPLAVCDPFLAFCRARFCALALFAAVPEQGHAAVLQQLQSSTALLSSTVCDAI